MQINNFIHGVLLVAGNVVCLQPGQVHVTPTARKIGAITVLFFKNCGLTYFVSHKHSGRAFYPVFSEKASFIK